MSYESGEVAEQVVRMSLEGAEVAARLTGKAAERLVVLLYAVLQDQKKTRGKTRLAAMLKSGKPLKVFSVNENDLERFCKEAKKYGVLYCVLKDKTVKDHYTDVFIRAEDASKINRIFERLGLATADMGDIRSKVQRDLDGQAKAKEKTSGDDIAVQDRSTTEKDKEESLLDQLLAPETNKEAHETENPSQARIAKSGQSGPTFERQRSSAKTDISDPERSDSGKAERRSVREELMEIREEQKRRAESRRERKAPERGHEDKTPVKENKER